MSVWLLVALFSVLPFCWCNEELGAFSEHALKSSSLWQNNNPKLVLIKKDTTVIPANYLQFVRRNLSEGSPARLIDVECPRGEPLTEGGICSLLSEYHVVLRLSDGDEGIVGKNFPFADYQKEIEFLADILESLIGDSLSHISDHSSLTSFLTVRSEALVAWIPDRSMSGYSSFLTSYLVHRPGAALAIISSVSLLPLSKRPRHTATPRLHLWNVLRSGSAWHTCPGVASIENFLLRTSYPEKITFEENTDILKEFKKKKVTYALFFPPIPVPGPFERFIERVSSRIYSVYVFVTVDRTKSRELAKYHFIADSTSQGHILAIAYGSEVSAIGLEVEGNNVHEEASHITEALLDIYKESQLIYSVKVGVPAANESPADEGSEVVPTISITDFSAMAIAIEHFKTDLVFLFCEQETTGCPDDMYIVLEKAYRAVLQAQLKSLHFFVVECRSMENVKKYNLDGLPSYAIYHRTKKTMVPGTGDVQEYRDILSFISKITGFTELGSVEPVKTSPEKDADKLLRDLSLEGNFEHDMYGRIVQTLPPASLPEELVLTSENFAERVGKYDRTAVMFYMSWSVKSKVALHHLTAAYDRLDKKNPVALGSVACNSYTDLCTRYNVTVYPSVLIFTPSTLSSPAPLPPSIGVIDSVHLLKALSTEQDSKKTLMEISPATLPVVMKRSLKMPLVLWCDTSSPTSELGAVFTDVALSDTSKDVAYAWLNCKKYGSILEGILEMQRGSACFNVFGFRLHKRAVYQLDKSAMQLGSMGFKDALLDFVQKLKDDTLRPTMILPKEDFMPVEPPIYFPSSGVEEKGKDEMVINEENKNDKSSSSSTHHHVDEL